MSNVEKKPSESSAPLHGVLAEYEGVTPLMEACAKVRDAGYKKWDAHTPFPVHGLDKAMGIKPTKLPWLVLLCGITGLTCAISLQYWTNVVDYAFRISGKPYFSLPSNIPVCFELTVLLSAFGAFFGTMAFNKLPELFRPVFTAPRFRRATADRFFIYVEAKDPNFSAKQLSELFGSTHATAVEQIFYDEHTPAARLPKTLVGAFAVLTAFTVVPLALVARARETTSSLPRIHPIPDDMDSQYKFKAQASNWFFTDGRAMREPPEGTVALGELHDDDPLYKAKTADANQWVTGFPVAVNDATMARGRDRFGIYCAPCHGISGRGDGMVDKRASSLMEGTWITPTSLHDARVRALPSGDIFNTITHGIRNMPAYGHSIDPSDRWAIVMYVRALQLSQNAPKSAVPAEVLPALQ